MGNLYTPNEYRRRMSKRSGTDWSKLGPALIKAYLQGRGIYLKGEQLKLARENQLDDKKRQVDNDAWRRQESERDNSRAERFHSDMMRRQDATDERTAVPEQIRLYNYLKENNMITSEQDKQFINKLTKGSSTDPNDPGKVYRNQVNQANEIYAKLKANQPVDLAVVDQVVVKMVEDMSNKDKFNSGQQERTVAKQASDDYKPVVKLTSETATNSQNKGNKLIKQQEDVYKDLPLIPIPDRPYDIINANKQIFQQANLDFADELAAKALQTPKMEDDILNIVNNPNAQPFPPKFVDPDNATFLQRTKLDVPNRFKQSKQKFKLQTPPSSPGVQVIPDPNEAIEPEPPTEEFDPRGGLSSNSYLKGPTFAGLFEALYGV